MADRYWVGGTASWDATAGTKWSATSGGTGGASVPTSADDVYFNAASGTVTVTISATGACKSINCTGFTGTLAGSSALTVAGSITLVAAMTVTYGGTITLTGTGTLISAGKSLGALTINAAGIVVTLGDALTLTGNITVTQGTFTTNNFNVTAVFLITSGSNTCTINLGSSTVTVSNVSFSTSTNFTFNAGTSTIIITSSSPSMGGGSKNFYNVTFSNQTGSIAAIIENNTFNNLSILRNTTDNSITFQLWGQQTINGLFSVTGTAGNRRVLVRTDAEAIQRTLVVNGTTNLTDVDFVDIYVVGTAAPITGTRIGNAQRCRGITFSAPKTVYWNLAGAQNWTANGWTDTPTGTPSTDYFPLPQDTATFTNSGSVTGTITLSAGRLQYTGTVDMSARTSAMTLNLAALYTVYGNWKNGSGTTITGSAGIAFSNENTQTITSAGKAFPSSNTVNINTWGGTVELTDALNIGSSTLRFLSGTLDTKNYNVTAAILDSINSNVRGFILGSSTISLSSGNPLTFTSTNHTFNAGTSQINFTNSGIVNAQFGGVSCYNVTYTSASNTSISIPDATSFNNLTVTAPTSGITNVNIGTNITVNGTLTTAGASPVRRIFVISNTFGTPRTLTVNSLSATDCDFRDIVIAGSAANSAQTRAGDCGGNSGITFPSPKTVYWNLAGTQNWSATAWADTSNGTPDINNFPLAQDTAIFDNAGAAGTVNINLAWSIGTINAGTRTSAMTLAYAASIPVYGNITLGTGVTTSSSNTTQKFSFSGRATQLITSNGVSLRQFDIYGFNNTVQLADAVDASNGSINLVTGTFDAVSYNVTAASMFLSGTERRTLKMGSGLWTLTGASTEVWNAFTTTNLNFQKNTADILLSNTTTSARTFHGGGLSYNKLTIGGTTGISTLTITGNNQFTELASTKTVAHTIALGTTIQYFGKWSVSGTAGNVVTVTGTGTSHQIIGSRVSGVNYLAMDSNSFSTSSPGEFYAGANSTGSSASIIKTAAPAARTLYWVGGTGNWNNTASWSTNSGGTGGAALPTSVDTVIFNSASNATAYTSTINDISRCGSLQITGPASGNVTLAGSSTLIAHGNVTLPSTGLTRTYTGTIILSGSTTGKTLTTNGVTLPNSAVVIEGVGCAWTLGSALSCSLVEVRNGEFNSAGFNITAGSILSSSYGPALRHQNSRTINLSSSTINLSFSPPVNFSANNLNFNAGTSQIICSANSTTFNGLSNTYYNVSFTDTGSATLIINGASTFNNLSIVNRSSAGLLNTVFNANQTVNGTLTLSAGTDATRRHFVRSDTIGTTRTLTCAAVSATDVDFRDITIAGAAAPVSGTRLGDCKGNSGIVFPAPKTVYYRGSGDAGWGSTSWSETIGGTASATFFPLAQDTGVIPSAYPNTGSALSINASYNIGTIDMSARTSNTVTLGTGSSTPIIHGNWINGTGTTLSGTGVITFAGRGTQTITSAGKTFSQPLTINSPNGTLDLQDAFISSQGSAQAIRVDFGTFNAVSYNVTNTVAGGGVATDATTQPRTLAFGSGTWTLAGSVSNSVSTNLTVTGTGTISLTSASAKTFSGGGISYSGITLNQGGAGTLTIINNNTFANITNSYKSTGATTIALSATTQRVARWTARGEANRLLTITGTSTASPATLILTGNTAADVNYLAITNVRAYPLQDKWYAGPNSANNGSLGWIFSSDVSDLKNIYCGSANPVQVYYGSTFVSAIYYGDSVVWRTRPPITFVASSTGESSNDNDLQTVTVSKPTGVINGDLMIAVMCGGLDAETWTGASGWTEIADHGVSPNLRIAYRVASFEGSNYTFTVSDGVNKAVVIVAYRNATYAQIGSFSTVATSGAEATAPAINVASENSLLLACFGTNNGSNFTTPSGMSSVVVNNSSVNPAVAVFSQQVGSGSTGSKSSDPSGSGNVSGILLALGRA